MSAATLAIERSLMTKEHSVCRTRTGGYERLVVGRLRETTIGVDVAHPVRVRAFARACGYEAKTDPLDAQVLSRYGVVFTESDTAQPEADPDREELRQLLGRRRQPASIGIIPYMSKIQEASFDTSSTSLRGMSLDSSF